MALPHSLVTEISSGLKDLWKKYFCISEAVSIPSLVHEGIIFFSLLLFEVLLHNF